MSLQSDFIDLRTKFFLAKNDWEKNYRPRLWAQGIRVAIFKIDDLGREIENMFRQAGEYLGVKKYELAAAQYIIRFAGQILTFATIALLIGYIAKKVTQYVTAYKTLSNPSVPEPIKTQIADRAFEKPTSEISIPGLGGLKISQNILLIGMLLLVLFLGRK